MNKKKVCKYCTAPLKKDWIALNKKLFTPDISDFLCLACMAQDFGCSVEDLEIKIQEFKEQGCTLF